MPQTSHFRFVSVASESSVEFECNRRRKPHQKEDRENGCFGKNSIHWRNEWRRQVYMKASHFEMQRRIRFFLLRQRQTNEASVWQDLLCEQMRSNAPNLGESTMKKWFDNFLACFDADQRVRSRAFLSHATRKRIIMFVAAFVCLLTQTNKVHTDDCDGDDLKHFKQ